jgi:ubiquitin C-terminal hydrolase
MYYQLTGIVQHEGSTLENGHYVAVIRHGNEWFKKDDTQVEIVNYW